MVMATSAITTTTQDYATINLDRELVINHGQSNDGAKYGKVLTKDALKRRIEDIDTDGCNPGEEDAFFVADLGEVYRQHVRWKMNLKRVKPHYGTPMFKAVPRRSQADVLQPSNATPTTRCYGFLQHLARASIVRPRPR